MSAKLVLDRAGQISFFPKPALDAIGISQLSLQDFCNSARPLGLPLTPFGIGRNDAEAPGQRHAHWSWGRILATLIEVAARGGDTDTAYFFAACTIACAFAPLTASRNGRAAAGAATRPSSVARVVTLGPYIACLELLSARTNAPTNVSPRKAPLARE